jgi:hypothetical protein
VRECEALGRAFEFIEAFGQIGMQGAGLAQRHEGTHDIDVHFDSLGSGQHIGRLDGTILGEGERQSLGELQLLEVVAICDHLGLLCGGELCCQNRILRRTRLEFPCTFGALQGDDADLQSLCKSARGRWQRRHGSQGRAAPENRPK